MYSSKQGRFTHRLITFFGMIGLGFGANAQIGGNSASAGHFLLEGAEDLNLTAESMGRDWVSDFVWPAGSVLEAVSLAGLTPATGQSTNGALLATVPDDGFGSINAGFGIPMPGVVGASTLDSPGNIASFSSLAFFARHEAFNASGIDFQILLECYPQNGDGSYPQLLWKYTPVTGTTFQAVSIDLRSPETILNNQNNLTIEQLLAETRFLYFYFFANPVAITGELRFHIDDISLEADPFPAGSVAGETSADGAFVIDSVEDVDLTADPLGRNWLSDFVPSSGDVLSAIDLSSSGLTPSEGQSPTGALKVSIPDDGFGTISAGFGVPLPGVVGASTAVSPGDMTSYEFISFSSRASVTVLANQKFQLLVECYPENSDGTFPTVFWEFSPEQGTSFASVNLGIDQPDGIINNPGAIAAQELLSRTRFLYFSHFANPVADGTQLDAHYDDIQLGPEVTATNAVGAAWTMYP